MNKDAKAIGVFDSGIGGLTAVKELIELLPNENIVYLGDTARIPYGTKSRETIAKYASQDIEFLKSKNVKMIIVACGTVSAVISTSPVFDENTLHTGVLMPAVNAAVKATKNKKIGVIGTIATIKSRAYETEIKKLLPDCEIAVKACPLFVPLAENGYTQKGNKIATLVAEEYLESIKNAGVDTLIMGCTHYPLLKDIIGEIMGEGVTLISPGAEAAKFAKELLSEKGLLSEKSEKGKIEFYCTDSTTLFKENIVAFLGNDVNGTVSKCELK